MFETIESIEEEITKAKMRLREKLIERIAYNTRLIESYNECFDAGILSNSEIDTYDMLTETLYSDNTKLSAITF